VTARYDVTAPAILRKGLVQAALDDLQVLPHDVGGRLRVPARQRLYDCLVILS
jgi:hypothetical protein